MKSIHYKLIVSAFALMGLWSCSEDESPNSSINSSASEGNSSASIEDPTNPGDDTGESSASEDGASSTSKSSSSTKNSSSSKTTVSSSSVVLPAGTYEKLTTANAKPGWGSRYWDGCKPHCAWRENVDITANPFKIAKNCSEADVEIPSFTLSPNASKDWTGYEGTKSSCDAGGVAFTCTDMAPIAVNDTLAYAFVATDHDNASCGQCFQIQFDGGTHNNNNDVKEAHKLLKGRTLIVMAANTGKDVDPGQFDILIPGGGVGQYDSFSNFLGVSKSDMGEQYGGFLSTCQSSLGYDKPASSYKTCVTNKCNAIFGKDAKFANLLRGCLWFADWYQTADNPTYLYKEVECPAHLTNTYPSSINTTPKTSIKAGGY